MIWYKGAIALDDENHQGDSPLVQIIVLEING